MIASGEKAEEYREIKEYWVARLVDVFEHPRSWEVEEGFAFMWKGTGPHGMESAQHYDVVQFRNGYSKNAPAVTIEIKDITQGYGKEAWGAEPGKPYFVIKLGKIIQSPNTQTQSK